MDHLVTPSGEPEYWLPVAGYEGLYEVSNAGRVRSLPRKGRVGVVVLQPQGRQQRRVTLFRDGKRRPVEVRDLVFAAFPALRPVEPDLIKPSGEPERWLPVVGWEGFYEVSDMGRVRSLPRALPRGRCSGQILKPYRDPNGYFRVMLARNGRQWNRLIHVLVAEAFIGSRPEGHQVCHGPAGQRDNQVTNLSYGTPAKNCGPDKYRDGTMPVGVRSGLAKLTDEIVRECRARVAAGETKAALARQFGVDYVTILHAVRGDTWKHVA